MVRKSDEYIFPKICRKMWSNQENRVRKQVKNPCEARKIKASQNLHKKLALTSCYYSVAFVLVHRVP